MLPVPQGPAASPASPSRACLNHSHAQQPAGRTAAATGDASAHPASGGRCQQAGASAASSLRCDAACRRTAARAAPPSCAAGPPRPQRAARAPRCGPPRCSLRAAMQLTHHSVRTTRPYTVSACGTRAAPWSTALLTAGRAARSTHQVNETLKPTSLLPATYVWRGGRHRPVHCGRRQRVQVTVDPALRQAGACLLGHTRSQMEHSNELGCIPAGAVRSVMHDRVRALAANHTPLAPT